VDSRRKLTNSHRGRRAFTLIEALVALLMFTVIMASLSLAFRTLTKTETKSSARQDDNAVVRVIFDALRRDIQAAYASTNDPMSVFIANTSPSGGGGNQSATGSDTTTVGSPGILTFTTNSYRIQADELSQQGGAQSTSAIGSNNGNSSNAIPQAGFQIVRYDLDSGSGTLLRSVFTAPNLTLVQAPSPGDPGSILASGITNIQFQFWDPNQNTWRDSWDYEQSNLTTSQANSGTSGAASGTSGGTSAGSSASSSSSSSSTSTATTSYTTLTGTTIGATTGDVTFPSAVQVTVEMRNSNGERVTYSTIIPVAAGIPYMDVSTLKNTSSSTSSSSSSSGSKSGN
jgi:type II secretory pathway pseudopilin PulG